MNKSPMEINPILSPMHIDFDRNRGIESSPAVKVLSSEAPEKFNPQEDHYPLEPPVDDIGLSGISGIEEVSDEKNEQEQQKKQVIAADKKLDAAKKKATRRTSTKGKDTS